MFWVISVYFNIMNTLPKSGTFLLGHPVYYRLVMHGNSNIKKKKESFNLRVNFLPFGCIKGERGELKMGYIWMARGGVMTFTIRSW